MNQQNEEQQFSALYLEGQNPAAQGILEAAFRQIVEEGLLESLFYDGTVNSRDHFLDVVLRPGTLPFVVMCKEQIAALTWLNCIEGRAARVHFVIFRKFWGRKTHRRIGWNLYRYILSRQDEAGYLFDCLYGVTPETNLLAWRAAIKCGWKLAGTIPARCFIAASAESVGGVVTSATREILGIAEGEEVPARW